MSEVFATEVVIKLVVKTNAIAEEIARNLVYSVHMSCNMFARNSRCGEAKTEECNVYSGAENARIAGGEEERQLFYQHLNSICERGLDVPVFP